MKIPNTFIWKFLPLKLKGWYWILDHQWEWILFGKWWPRMNDELFSWKQKRHNPRFQNVVRFSWFHFGKRP